MIVLRYLFESSEAVCVWDRVKILSSGANATSVTLGEAVIVWFKAAYEHDDKTFDQGSGALMINDEEASWNEDTGRWESQVTHSGESSETLKVTEIEDHLCQLTMINHEAAEVKVSWEDQASEEENVGGISGFPLTSLLLGIMLVLIIARRKKYSSFF